MAHLRIHENSGVSLCKYRSHKLLRSSDGGADTDKYFYPRKEGRIALGRREPLKADENPEGLISNPRLHAWYLGNTGAGWPPQRVALLLLFHWWQSTVQLSREGFVCSLWPPTHRWHLFIPGSPSQHLSHGSMPLWGLSFGNAWLCEVPWSFATKCVMKWIRTSTARFTYHVGRATSLLCNSKYYDSECKNVTFLDIVVGGNYGRF